MQAYNKRNIKLNWELIMQFVRDPNNNNNNKILVTIRILFSLGTFLIF